MVTVFYDGLCGLCSREIAHYKNIAPEGIFTWVDIAKNPQALEAHNINIIDALKYLHVIDKNGSTHKGVRSFQVIWEQLPRWKILSKLLRFKIFYFVADSLYIQFASWRFERSTHCQLSFQNDNMT